jgi:endo-beta-N-acetylglucosaminidase D
MKNRAWWYYEKWNFGLLAGAIVFLAGSGTPLWGQFSLVPTSPQWNPDEILSWNPASDANAPYNQSKVPLATRITVPTAAQNAALNAAWNVNSHARPGEGKIQAVTTFNTIPAGATHGWRTTRLYAPSMWQYTDNLVFWGSSDRDTKTILAPTAHMIEAAHRNGVRIYGKVFFNFDSSTATLEKVRDLLQKSGDTFPVADKMIEAATYYGFDGWFINQENSLTNSTDAQNMRDFLEYYRANAPANQKIVWYDAMAENGSRSFQNALTTSNDAYLKSGSTLRAHEMFLNFWWYYDSTNLSDSRTLANSLGLDPYDLYAGIWTENNRAYGKTPDPNGGGNIDITWDYLFPEGQPHHTSVALFGSETPFVKGSSPATVVAQEQIYYSGPNQDPSNTPTPAGSSIPNWPGMAYYIPAHSALTSLPFVTNFNVGQGTFYKIDGVTRMTGPWTNVSVQDILPTWRWMVESSGAETITPSLDFTEAYYGPSSLKVTGSLAAGVAQDVKLYQADLPIAGNTNLRLVYKPGAVNDAEIRVGYAFDDAPGTMFYSDPASASSTNWTTFDFSLGAHAGKKIAVLTLRFSSAGGLGSYTGNIGRLQISNGSASAPAAPSGLLVEGTGSNPENAYSTQLRLKWTASASPVRYYNVYYRKDLTPATDNQIVWLGATQNNCFFAQDIRRTDTESSGYIQVEAVGPDYGVSSRISTAEPTFTFASLPDLSNKLTGTVIGTDGSFGGGSNTKDKVYDGLLNTYFDALETDGAWAGLDLGSGNAQQITAIRYSPRNSSTSSSNNSRMVNGKFQGSNNLSSWTDLYTVLSIPPYNEYTTVLVNNATAFRYVRYLSPNGGFCNVSEVEFYGVPAPPTVPAGLATISLNTTATVTWTAQSVSTTYDLKRATAPAGPYTTLASDLPTASYADSGLEAGTVYFYRVSAENSVGTSSDSSTIIVSNSNINRLLGTVIGTDGAFCCSRVKENVYDGNLATYFDAPLANGAWAGLDLGAGNEKAVTRIRYSPRNSSTANNNNANRMIGGQFQGANSADFSDVVTLYTVPSTPSYNLYTTVMISNGTPFRYLRYLSPNGGSCNVSEVEFYGPAVLPAVPTGVAGTLQDGTANLAWDSMATAVGYRVKRASSSGGPYTVLPPNVTALAFQENGLNLATTYYYVVSAVNEAGESADSTPLEVADLYAQWVQASGATPGDPGTDFTGDFDGNGVSNAVEYTAPAGLAIVPDVSTSTVTANIRQDAQVTVTLWATPDLVAWSPIALEVAPDQNGVPAGFVRMQAQESVGTQKFYRLQMIR